MLTIAQPEITFPKAEITFSEAENATPFSFYGLRRLCPLLDHRLHHLPGLSRAL